MQRLVYSPKVQAYVQTQEGILDISPFIVNGSVSRVVNEVSTAELTIRNPHKRFTKPGDPTFRPMDGITIFASRFKDRPVQLFTGYLDTTPYLQLFPGTCTIRASCTLKRLLYTYMDGGLPHTIDFFSKYGWNPLLESGQIWNPAALTNKDGDSAGGKFTDGSIGNLIVAVLNEIGNWKKDQILVESFPDDAGKIVKGLVKNMQKSYDEAEDEFSEFLENMIGDYTGGGGATSGGGTLDPGGKGPPSKTIVSPEDVGFSMLRAGFPANAKVLASGMQTMEVESAFGAGCAADGWGLNDYGCCAGYWQIYLSVHNVSMECANNLDCSTKAIYPIWKSAGGCFACQPGPNPWQGGTDSPNSSYLRIAERVIKAAKDHRDRKNRSISPNAELND